MKNFVSQESPEIAGYHHGRKTHAISQESMTASELEFEDICSAGPEDSLVEAGHPWLVGWMGNSFGSLNEAGAREVFKTISRPDVATS